MSSLAIILLGLNKSLSYPKVMYNLKFWGLFLVLFGFVPLSLLPKNKWSTNSFQCYIIFTKGRANIKCLY